ncbi:MAG: enoyl-CoA hydratase/isomerase family protein [Chloroflexi bacterium]|nr:enoyl-CoA hydratase/isomerase family protein [Chloroflexota bacterium]
MQFETLACTEKDGILHVRLNRPEKRNAINPQMFLDIDKCFTEVATQPGVQVVLLSGEGKGFSAGTDLTTFQAGSSQQDVRRFVRLAQRAYNEIEYLEKVVIALVHNFCFGIACEMVLACDMRLCSPDATFNIPEVAMGLVPDDGASQRLPRIVGVGRAKELILTGKTIGAQKAESWGMVNEVVKLEELEKTGIAWAREIMGNGPIGVGLAKRNIDMSMNMSVADGLECAGMAQSLGFSDPGFLKRMEQRLIEKTKGKKP